MTIYIKKVLADHKEWLTTGKGARANLFGADLRSANLFGADLRSANLFGADLRSADLFGADLRSADLFGANLRSADLRSADLSGANLFGADLRSADLRSADLSGANLFDANLSGRKPLFADTERNYVLYVISEAKDGPRFIAGCRNFTYDEAITHWSTKSIQPDYIAAINKYIQSTKGEV